MATDTERARAEPDQMPTPERQMMHKNRANRQAPNVLDNANKTSASFGDLRGRKGRAARPRNRETR